jgi:hypothetical protein
MNTMSEYLEKLQEAINRWRKKRSIKKSYIRMEEMYKNTCPCCYMIRSMLETQSGTCDNCGLIKSVGA